MNWEITGYAFEKLDYADIYNMPNGGAWAPSIRYYDNLGFFVTCISDKPEGPYEKQILRNYRLYDPGVFFDDDGRVYVSHGQMIIDITELSPDFLSVVISQKEIYNSGKPAIEGSHVYKTNGW